MKIKFITIFIIGFVANINAQIIQVDDDNYTPQELIEDVLFPDNTNCVQNVTVNNAVGGNFSGTKSYGYFQSSGSGFLLESGIVLSTGRLTNVPGPNNNLSDDDAANWGADDDLESVLGISDTTNATSITFQFTPQASTLSFRYLFASEEYRDDNPTTCDFSDAFGFLIKPVGGSYQNIAVVPGTNTPVSVTTVRPAILDVCDAVNEEYFDQFNNVSSPINFNGQTKVLTAQADVTPGTTYEIKLVIADDINYRYDSAVFIEANSFNFGVDLGQDLIGDNALCGDESALLEVDENLTNIEWYFNDSLVEQNTNELIIDASNFGEGTYSVEATLPSGCIASDDIIVDFEQNATLNELSLQQCDDNSDELAVFNLLSIDQKIANQNQNLSVDDYFLTEDDAVQNINPIESIDNFANTSPNQVIFIRVNNANGCNTVEEVELIVTPQTFDQVEVVVCPVNETSPISYGFSDTMSQVAASINENQSDISLHPSRQDAAFNINEMVSGFIEIPEEELPKTLYVRVQPDFDCAGIVPVKFYKLAPPDLNPPDENVLICEGDQEEVVLDPGINASSDSISFNWDNGATTSVISVNEPGTYSVTVDQVSSVGNQELICSATATFDVVVSEAPEITTEITGVPGDNQVIITAEGSGDYEFALNSTTSFQDDNVFQLTDPINTIYVRDKNGCGIVSKDIEVFQFADFFTPNGDGINDVWRPVENQIVKQQVKRIDIFDRYGKLIKTLRGFDFSWNGRLNGNVLPSNDYWFLVVFSNGQKITGNLTLKR